MKPPTLASWPVKWGAKRARDAHTPAARPHQALTDEMLLAGYGASDPTAALAFVRRFQGSVYGTALIVCADPALAEDIAQQSFERAWRHADQYDPCRGTVKSWLVKIAHNLAVDTLRARRSRPVEQQDLERFLGPATATPEGHALAQATSQELRNALATLPVEQARAVVLAAVHGFTAAEIAEHELIPVGTAKSRIRAGLTKLRDVTLRGGHTWPA